MKKLVLSLMLLLAAGSSVELLGASYGEPCNTIFGGKCDTGLVCSSTGLGISTCICPDGQHVVIGSGCVNN